MQTFITENETSALGERLAKTLKGGTVIAFFVSLYIADVFVPGLDSATKELFKMLPYLVTIIILIGTKFTKKKENQPPESLGLSYFREER